jgi:hypothetical protein
MLVADGGGGLAPSPDPSARSTYTLAREGGVVGDFQVEDFDSGDYRTWVEDQSDDLKWAANKFDIPPSVLAATMVVEHAFDTRSAIKFGGESCGGQKLRSSA